jgi:hypothetical protein
MPDPGGCYVLVYDQPEFMGAREFINGPAKYSTLAHCHFASTGGIAFAVHEWASQRR